MLKWCKPTNVHRNVSNWAVFDSKLSVSLFHLYFSLFSHTLWHVTSLSTWQKITLLCSRETTHGRSSLRLLLSPAGQKNKNKKWNCPTAHFTLKSLSESESIQLLLSSTSALSITLDHFYFWRKKNTVNKWRKTFKREVHTNANLHL